MDSKNGIKIKQPETIKAKIEEELKKAKNSYDERYNLYLALKKYINPIPKKEMPAAVFKLFHKNQISTIFRK